MTKPFQLSLLDREEKPAGVPLDVWTLFVREADKIRSMGRDHYSARTIIEHLRHNAFIENPGREFVINNNWVPDMARAYMKMRGCWSFFFIRDSDTKRAA
jgi:hypothetical protein